jgi:hypothetical protein
MSETNDSQTATVINNSSSPQMLEDGTVIGAAYTPEAKRENVTLSAADQRKLVDTGILSIVEPPPAGKTPVVKEEKPPKG